MKMSWRIFEPHRNIENIGGVFPSLCSGRFIWLTKAGRWLPKAAAVQIYVFYVSPMFVSIYI